MFTFLDTVSNSGAMPSSRENIGGLVEDCLIGFGNANTLPSSPNHSFPYKSKQNCIVSYFNRTNLQS